MPPVRNDAGSSLQSLIRSDGPVFLVEIQRSFWSLGNHKQHLAAVHLDLLRESTQRSIHYGLDFSDIYAYMRPGASDAEHARLAHLEIESLTRLTLLPGAAAELDNFLREYSARTSEALDAAYVRSIPESDVARDFRSIFEQQMTADDADMEAIAQAARRLFREHPILKSLEDHHRWGSAQKRLLRALQRLEPLVDFQLDAETFNMAWAELTELRPHKKLRNNRVDAFNYSIVAQRSKRDDGNYYVLLTCSEAPFNAFTKIEWESDPIREHPQLLRHYYNFSFVRSSRYAAYRVLLEREARQRGLSPLEFAATTLEAITIARTRLEQALPSLSRSLAADRPRSGSAMAEAARFGGSLVKDLRNLQESFFYGFLDRVEEELEIDEISELNRREFFAELDSNLEKPDSLATAIRFSYERLAESFSQMLHEISERAPEMRHAIDAAGLTTPDYVTDGRALSVAAVNEYVIAFENTKGQHVFYFEPPLAEDPIKVLAAYWPCAVPAARFVRIVADLLALLAGREFRRRIPVLAAKRFKPSLLLRATSGEEVMRPLADDDIARLPEIVDELGKAVRREAGDSSLALIRINTDFLDAWCDVGPSITQRPLCGILSHWNCLEAIVYSFSLSSDAYVSEEQFRALLGGFLAEFPTHMEASRR
jgi:hypothetical protein